jgi:hypothetical protein
VCRRTWGVTLFSVQRKAPHLGRDDVLRDEAFHGITAETGASGRAKYRVAGKGGTLLQPGSQHGHRIAPQGRSGPRDVHGRPPRRFRAGPQKRAASTPSAPSGMRRAFLPTPFSGGCRELTPLPPAPYDPPRVCE